MVVHNKKDEKRKPFKLGDILWVLLLAVMGLYLIYALMPLIQGWDASALKRQLLGG